MARYIRCRDLLEADNISLFSVCSLARKSVLESTTGLAWTSIPVLVRNNLSEHSLVATLIFSKGVADLWFRNQSFEDITKIVSYLLSPFYEFELGGNWDRSKIGRKLMEKVIETK